MPNAPHALAVTEHPAAAESSRSCAPAEKLLVFVLAPLLLLVYHAAVTVLKLLGPRA